MSSAEEGIGSDSAAASKADWKVSSLSANTQMRTLALTGGNFVEADTRGQKE